MSTEKAVNAVSDDKSKMTSKELFRAENAAPPEPKPVSDDVVYSVEERERAYEVFEEILAQDLRKPGSMFNEAKTRIAIKIQCALNRAESRLAAQGREIEEARELMWSMYQDAEWPDGITDAFLTREERTRTEAWLSRNQPQTANEIAEVDIMGGVCG